ncbi:unnamed protein product, partial [Staurois parvus]
MTVGSMYKRGMWRVWQWAVCTGEECGGYSSGSMYRRGVWRVWQWAICTGEECGGYGSGQYVQERS